jgi:Protein of unknown function (DUF2865)
LEYVMVMTTSGRIDPRALLKSVRTEGGKRTVAQVGVGVGRTVVVALAAVAGLGSFGTLVVRANDDSGALAFIRSQVKPRAPQVEYAAPRQAYPVSYYAPRAFLQPAVARRNAPVQSAAGAQQGARNGVIVASYAPFAGFFPSDSNQPSVRDSLRPRSATAPVRRKVAGSEFKAIAASGIGREGAVTYCVRTCDGFFFPLSNSTGSIKGDEAACNRLCPTAETRVFNGQIGADIEDARSRETGRRYAAMSNALTYRSSYSQSCTCSTSGLGLTNPGTVANDRTLKVGDVVMTGKGMRVFIGGQAPYREANFTSIDASRNFAGKSRETLRNMERASLPGRSGLTARQARPDELRDLRRAAASLEAPTQLVRYVGPDRSSIVR